MPNQPVFPLAASLLLSACSLNSVSQSTPTPASATPSSPDQPATPTPTQAQAQPTALQSYSMDEVATHDSAASCWLVIDGQVYDATPFIFHHPGGPAILEGCGRDATQLFNTRPMGSGTPHSAAARNTLKTYLIGTLE